MDIVLNMKSLNAIMFEHDGHTMLVSRLAIIDEDEIIGSYVDGRGETRYIKWDSVYGIQIRKVVGDLL